MGINLWAGISFMKDYYLNLIPTGKHEPKKVVELTCERCQNKFTVPFWMLKKGRRFCSRKCRKQDPMETLMSRVEKDPNGCWNWTGCVGWGGYAQIKVGKTNHLAHRPMWILWNKKPVPHGMVIRHTCIGNRRCINPDHLIPGTQKENIQDCIRQGRFPATLKGEESVNAKLTEENVRYIRAVRNPIDGSKPVTYRKLCEMFGVSYTAVWYAAHKRQWASVE